MDFDFEDTGTGPVLLFLPGSYSNYAAWKGIQKALKSSCRMISTSLPGYGGSKEIRGDTVQDITLMADFVVVEGANHFLISTHPEDCAKIIDGHMTAYTATHD